ncbi:MAG: DNA internalization-related competence protein ComEC/Rec2 [Gemmatimonadota bacterium]|nr:DNA internalization-related competence protein ComEC/Rec2 [Gemmatimonadota bacterium]
MPLLLHATSGWLLGLFIGASLSARGQSATMASALWWPPLALLILGIARLVRRRAAGGRGGGAPSYAALGVAWLGLGAAGLLSSTAAADTARSCRVAIVAALARGEAATLRFDGAVPMRAAAAGRPARTPVTRGRGEVRLLRDAHRCAVPATVRWARAGAGLHAGDIAPVFGRATATERGIRLEVDSVHAATGRATWRALRGRTGETIDRLFGEQAPLVRALVIADQDGITPDIRDRFADAGLVHVLSVSGMHVAIIASALLTLTAALRLPSAVGVTLSLLLVLAYVAMLGAPAPAVRSAVMLVVVRLAGVGQRPVHEWTALALGAAIPTVDPLVVVDLGWQLSVSGMAALLAARAVLRRMRPDDRFTRADHPATKERTRHGAPRLADRARRWVLRRRGLSRWLVRETITGLIATAVTVPLIAWTFGRVSLVAPFTNLAAAPVVAVLQPALFLALLASPCEPLARLFADAAWLPLLLLDRLAAMGAAVPHGVVPVAPTGVTAICAGVAASAMVGATAARRVGPWLRTAALAMALAVWAPLLDPGPGVLEVHMIDVGQGDALAVRTPRGRWVLIDAGPSWEGGDAGRRAVVPYLQRYGGAVALMVLSHAHEDHAGGAASVIAALAPRLWWESAFVTTSRGYHRALTALRDGGQPWRRVGPEQRWQLDGVTLDVLAPDSLWSAAQQDANETSVVVRVSYGQRRFLFMGDAEAHEEAWLLERLPAEDLRADVLKLGHHGSRTSSTEAFVRAVSPLVGLVSVGAGNRYGHPSPEILDRFAARGVPLLRSDLEGAVVLRTDGQRLEAIAHGDRWIVPARASLLPSRTLGRQFPDGANVRAPRTGRRVARSDSFARPSLWGAPAWSGIRQRRSSRSNGSSSSRSAISPRLPVNSPASSTTWRWPAR